MSLKITYSHKKNKAPLRAGDFKKVLSLVFRELKNTAEYEKAAEVIGRPQSLEIHFCDDKEMRSFQKQFRNLDRTTDVLSFPSLESPDHNEKGFLGSLIVSLATVERNAKRYKKTLKKELLEVYIHGILHLLSFDHVKVSNKKKLRMREFQKRIYALAVKVVKL